MSTAPRIAAAKKDWGHDDSGCTILHIDMDAFYASCELKRNPHLAGKPIIIGTGARSVVSAANYEARKYGVNSAMPVSRARQLCPQGVFLPVDMAYYKSLSAQVFAIFEEVTDQVEHVSVDEGYMDVSSALLTWKSPVAIAQWIRSTVFERLQLTCSVGIASNKLIAKLASTNAKPNGMLLIPVDKSIEFMHMLPVRAIPGVGPATQKALDNYGVSTVKQLAQLREQDVIRAVKSPIIGHTLFLAARGIDERNVVVRAPEKSIGHERTLEYDTRDPRVVSRLLWQCCDSTASTLRKRGLVARTLTVKLRYANLHYVSKSRTLSRPSQSAHEFYEYALNLMDALLPRSTGTSDTAYDTSSTSSDGNAFTTNATNSTDYTSSSSSTSDTQLLPQEIRLAGISTSHLSNAATTVIQQSFDDIFDDYADTPASSPTAKTPSSTDNRQDTQAIRKSKKNTIKTEKTLDDIRKRFGKDSISFGL
ncbi:DNA polymerase IV [Alloscardovia omnicolens]|mgnify:FL=1|uniref:DNA polymerase IV n=1 Tax=Alloscardovia omnicolens TaxID=419015 RepID=UPI0003B50A40|nr:DNA polymerase IV [Alloscardovia omnicolens]KWZ73996.1 ImpB/MucB/SamB family protein [Alloscardovia omnicolens]MDK6327442.1 DNA polymerase IV [Alloscardovia omnicolens]MDK6445598.1 DNA polymerase IV [Alloscardovia omnicolens]MDK6522689.1 DNA polymerase IV [Alloscardovia omnicolens]MDK6643095.1 DNA polymerase IV [Alloscardovia omnicolens]